MSDDADFTVWLKGLFRYYDKALSKEVEGIYRKALANIPHHYLEKAEQEFIQDPERSRHGPPRVNWFLSQYRRATGIDRTREHLEREDSRLSLNEIDFMRQRHG